MKLLRVTLPVLILAGCGGIFWRLVSSQPEPGQKVEEVRVHPVQAARVQPQDYTITVESRGTVRPRTESILIPEVSGQIVEISDSLRPGGFFEKGDLLLRVDPRDYEAAVTMAESQLAQAKVAWEEENARSEQAVEDWKRLGRSGEPPPLVARRPQVAEAQARIAAQEAALERARRDLERTRITAPYAGCVLEKMVDVGQVVSPSTRLAQIYAVDVAEIELPVTNEDLAFLDLPESYRGDAAAGGPGPQVRLKAGYGGREHCWKGRVVRTAGAIDARSRQLYVTAQVDDPYGRQEPGKPPLKAGLFVDARITGRTLADVFVIPRLAIRDQNAVMVIDANNQVRRRELDIVWSTRSHVVAQDGLKAGETVCLTRLPLGIDGLHVKPVLVPMPGSPEAVPAQDPPLSEGATRPRPKSA